MTRDSQKSVHEEVFKKLCVLVGQWQDNNASTLVNYRLSANDTVLVETWTWPEKNIEALTLYHMDVDQLMATHYCPVGNQPRLLFDSLDEPSVFTFKFVSATNLLDPGVDHNVEFWIKINESDFFTRSETYVESGVFDVQQSTYRRLS